MSRWWCKFKTLMQHEDYSELHNLYCSLTNRQMPLDMSMNMAWAIWKAKGWTPVDLTMVVRHLKHLIDRGKMAPTCLRFNRLIFDCENFRDLLDEAKAEKREERPKKKPLAFREKYPSSPEGDRAFAEFQKWKRDNL